MAATQTLVIVIEPGELKNTQFPEELSFLREELHPEGSRRLTPESLSKLDFQVLLGAAKKRKSTTNFAHQSSGSHEECKGCCSPRPSLSFHTRPRATPKSKGRIKRPRLRSVFSHGSKRGPLLCPNTVSEQRLPVVCG